MEGGVVDPDAAILPVVRFVPWTVPTVVHSFTISVQVCARVVLCITDSDQNTCLEFWSCREHIRFVNLFRRSEGCRTVTYSIIGRTAISLQLP
jgi:siroheme synthase (precorrin-2 oxidase/ferrochelatase)